MYDPNENKFVPVKETPVTPENQTWTRFEEGELVTMKGIVFKITEVGETRLILRPIKRN